MPPNWEVRNPISETETGLGFEMENCRVLRKRVLFPSNTPPPTAAVAIVFFFFFFFFFFVFVFFINIVSETVYVYFE
jgi:hypothetical protein